MKAIFKYPETKEQKLINKLDKFAKLLSEYCFSSCGGSPPRCSCCGYNYTHAPHCKIEKEIDKAYKLIEEEEIDI